MKLSRPYDNQGLTVFLLIAAAVLAAIGISSGMAVTGADPCLSAAQQESGAALTMPLTYIELAGSAVAVLMYWLFIQKQWFFGQNWLRWLLASIAGYIVGMAGLWLMSFLTVPCARKALASAYQFHIGPIFAFGNFFSIQFWNARAIEIAGWILASTAALWVGRYLWLSGSRVGR